MAAESRENSHLAIPCDKRIEVFEQFFPGTNRAGGGTTKSKPFFALHGGMYKGHVRPSEYDAHAIARRTNCLGYFTVRRELRRCRCDTEYMRVGRARIDTNNIEIVLYAREINQVYAITCMLKHSCNFQNTQTHKHPLIQQKN